jgi:hypothetical protein
MNNSRQERRSKFQPASVLWLDDFYSSSPQFESGQWAEMLA